MKNCWEVKSCGLEPGGKRAAEFGTCPAALDAHFDGLNGGNRGGRICWAVPETLCGGVKRDAKEKAVLCSACEFRSNVLREQGPKVVLSPGLGRARTIAAGEGIVVRVSHPANGSVEEATKLATKIRAAAGARGSAGVAILHDASKLQTASADYRNVFVALEQELGDRIAFVAAVFPNVLMRVLARTIHAASGTDWHFFRTVDEAIRELSHKGFREPA